MESRSFGPVAPDLNQDVIWPLVAPAELGDVERMTKALAELRKLHVQKLQTRWPRFIAARVCAERGRGRLAAVSPGIMFFPWVAILHAPRVAAALHNGDEWSSAFVALAVCGSSWIIAESFVILHRDR